jgi:hypothetical protein
MFRSTRMRTLSVLALVAAATVPAATAQTISNNSYGVPGLIDMPSAQMQPDGELTTTLALLSNGSGRVQLAFQVAPRVQGVFRYATLPDFLPDGEGGFERTYDRSFDLRLQLLRETARRPAVTLGLQDFGGTSIYSGEYLAATKSFGPRWTVTGGIGWGRFGSRDGFGNPLGLLDDRFDTRPGVDVGTGGDFGTDQIFRGDAALFGGVAFRATDRLTLKAEYSSDAYVDEERFGIVSDDSPVNLGFDYAVRPGLALGGYVLNGSEAGLQMTFALNPKRAPTGGGIDDAPLPVTLRPARAQTPELWTRGWVGDGRVVAPALDALDALLEETGLDLVAYSLEADRAEIRFRNRRYGSQAQAIGRAARAMTATMPPSVETFDLVPVNENGLAGTAVVLRRSDIEALEFAPDGTEQMLALAGLVDAATLDEGRLTYRDDAFPRFTWSLGPYTAFAYFDPDNPIRADLGAELSARYEPVPGLVLSGSVRQKIVGNRDDADRPSNSVLPRVRTETFLYARQDEPFIPRLTGAYYFRPGRALYGRVTAGLLETQYGGASAELLWAPTASRLAIGAEVNRVRQRDFDMRFDFRDLEATTAFVSTYYDWGNGFVTQLDAGQYLAGDQGATLTVTREFDNGWRIGAYATKTDVSSEDFGEGSFDKGIRIRIPVSWLTGRPTRAGRNLTIQPIQRDGGARLNVGGRLYPLVRDQVPPDLTDEWARFWR